MKGDQSAQWTQQSVKDPQKGYYLSIRLGKLKATKGRYPVQDGNRFYLFWLRPEKINCRACRTQAGRAREVKEEQEQPSQPHSTTFSSLKSLESEYGHGKVGMDVQRMI